MVVLKSVIGVLGSAVLFSSVVWAGDKEDLLIDKVVNAYGGDRLTTLQSLVMLDQYKIVSQNGRRPGEGLISRLHSKLTVDFETGRKAVKNWTVNQSGKRLDQIMFDGEKGWSVNYLRGSHVERPDLNGNNVGAGMLRLLDTTLAYMLNKDRGSAEVKGVIAIDMVPHQAISFKIGGKTQVQLFVDAQTGLIRQMQRGGTKYVYSEYRKKAGLTYAASTDTFNDDRARMLTLAREIQVNPDVSKAFIVPANSKQLEGMQDTRLMQVNEVAAGVYIVGKGFSSSIFVDCGDHFVGAGGLGGFQARLDALNEHLGTDKSVKFQVLPEFQGHLGGVNEIADHGAVFVTTQTHLAPLKDRIKNTLPAERFLLVQEQREFSAGSVQVYEIETLLSEQYLLFYVPSAKLVFTVDEFGTQLLNSVPSANKNMLSFRKAIEQLGLDVENIGYIHGPGVLSMAQLREVTDNYKEGYCPQGHEICVY